MNGHHHLKPAQPTILTPSFAKSLFSSKSKSESESDDNNGTVDSALSLSTSDSQSICNLLNLTASSSLSISNAGAQAVVSSLERTNDLYTANMEWWQSQFEWLRPTLMPQSLSHPELSRDLAHCRCTIFSKSVSTPSQSGSGHLLFDENKYIEHLLESSCNLWTLMHVCCAYYRSFDWKNAHLALLRMATELSGRSRPCSEHSRTVYRELMESRKTRLQFQRTMQHLHWLTGEQYTSHRVQHWKR